MGTRKGRGAEGPPPKRPRGPRPSLPDEIAGLFAALRLSGCPDRGPIGRWVDEKQPLLEAALRSWGRSAADALLLADLLVEEAFVANTKGRVIQREIPWISGTIAHLWQKTCYARRREKEKAVPIAEVPSPWPTPFEILSEADESTHRKEKVLEAVRILPQPFGHVLHWRVLDGMPWQEVQVRLNAHRPRGTSPIGRRQTEKVIKAALAMLRGYIEGVPPRAGHPQKYLPKKNPWIGSQMPLLRDRTRRGAQRLTRMAPCE